MEGIVDGRYKLRREIARGGHGLVFEAEHLITRVRVALKLLAPAAFSLPQAEPRLFREARVLGLLGHVNVVQIHDAGKCPEFGPYLALEMIEGRSLQGILLTRHILPVDQAVAIVIQLCEALREVHRHNIVHRDVKPGNVLISRTSRGEHVELIDFGIATLPRDPNAIMLADDGSYEDEAANPDKITKLGDVIGTVEYMAPEQLLANKPLDERADIYSVGAMLYECLAGDLPYQGNATQVITRMLTPSPPPAIAASRPDVPPALEAAVFRAIAIDADKRFQSATELARACLAAVGGSVPSIELLDVRAESTAQLDAGRAPQAVTLPHLTGSQRRQHARAPYVTPVRVVLAAGNAYDGRTEDISEGGLLVVTDFGRIDDQRVKVRLPLPLSGRVVVLDATTKWVKTRRGQRATGVEFEDAPEDVRAEIHKYVALMSKPVLGKLA